MRKVLKVFTLFLFLMACSRVEFNELIQADRYEKFNYKHSSKIDLLVVIDNSGSMSEERKRMGERMEHFLSLFQGMDWRLAITTTETENKRSTRGEFLEVSPGETILTSRSKDFKKKFLETLEDVGCHSSCDSEHPLEAIYMSLEKSKKETRALFRNDTNLAVLVLTDEDETKSSRGSKSFIGAQDVLRKFSQLWRGQKTFSVHGVIIEPGDSSCSWRQSGGREAVHVKELIDATGGVSTSVCLDDYSKGLTYLGQGALRGTRTFRLQEIPVVGSVKVVTSPKQKIDFQVDGALVYIKTPLQADTKIEIYYQPLKD